MLCLETHPQTVTGYSGRAYGTRYKHWIQSFGPKYWSHAKVMIHTNIKIKPSEPILIGELPDVGVSNRLNAVQKSVCRHIAYRLIVFI
jgi:hypothetical protein